MSELFKRGNKKGMSNIVSTVIIIALVMAAVLVVWNVVYPMIQGELEQAGSCQDVMGQVDLNNKYTCYDSANNRLYFNINQKDVELSKVIVSVDAGPSGSLSYEIPGSDEVKDWDGNEAELPGKNSGTTYNVSVDSEVSSIDIIPSVGGSQCSGAGQGVLDVALCTPQKTWFDEMSSGSSE